MKKTPMKLMVLMSFLSAVPASYAHEREPRHERGCTQIDNDLIRREVVHQGSCETKKQLSLTMGYFNYKRLGHLPVEFWEGSYEKTVTIRNTYLRTVTNVCTGDIQKSFYTHDEDDESLCFNVENPNLDPWLSHSYALVPMTDEEAQKEMEFTRERCEKGKVQESM